MADDEILEETSEETTEPTAEVVEETSAWSPSEDEWKAMHDFTASAAPVLSQLQEVLNAPPLEAEEPEPEYNPFDPESVQSLIDRRAEMLVEQALGPYKGLLGLMAEEKGELYAKQELDSIKEEVGEFDKDMAYLIGNGIVQQNPDDPRTALRTAAQHVHSFEAKIRADERARVQEEFKTLGQAPSETPGSGPETGEIERVPTGSGRYEKVISRHLASMRPTNPVG